MKKFLTLCVTAILCGCAHNTSSNGDIDVYESEQDGHKYYIYENTHSGSISVIHAESCECKTNK